jgi:hypothetical protein
MFFKSRYSRDPTNPEIPSAMKPFKIMLAAAVFTGLASLGVAGPGPQYWAEVGKQSQKKPASYPSIWRDSKSKDADAKTAVSAKPAPAIPAECKACAECVCCVKKS